MAQRIAQVHDQGVEIVGETASGRLIAGVLEIVDQDLEA
jgi:biotin operon repressor